MTAKTTDERLIAIETELKHVATKADLEREIGRLKAWVLTAGLGAGSAGGFLTWLARFLGEP